MSESDSAWLCTKLTSGSIIAELSANGDMLASPHLNQRLMEHLNTGIVLLDADLSIIFMNPAAEALL